MAFVAKACCLLPTEVGVFARLGALCQWRGVCAQDLLSLANSVCVCVCKTCLLPTEGVCARLTVPCQQRVCVQDSLSLANRRCVSKTAVSCQQGGVCQKINCSNGWFCLFLSTHTSTHKCKEEMVTRIHQEKDEYTSKEILKMNCH